MPSQILSRIRLWAACAVLSAVCFSGCDSETQYPGRPITLVCPWSVGGGTDRVSRQMALFLEHELGVPVNVINATGGQGVTGHRKGLKARPDGYTIAVITLELNMLHWQNLTSLDYDDAELLMSVNEDAAALFVRADSPWQSVDDLLADVARRPGELTASGTALGGAWHVALAGWLMSVDREPTDIKWITAKGAAPSLKKLASGEVDIVCCSMPETRGVEKSVDLRCLGVMSDERSPFYPDVPTLKEVQGTDWTLVGWRGLAVPKGTPPERVDLLVSTIEKIVSGRSRVLGKTFPEFMETERFNNRYRKPEEFAEFLRDNDEKFGKLLTSDAFKTIAAGRIGPGAFPNLLFGVLAVLLAAIGIQRLRRGTGEITTGDTSGKTARSSRSGIVNCLLLSAGVILYAAVAEDLGFLLTAGSLFLLLLIRMGTRIASSAAITILFIPGVYYLFSHLLRVPLPRGLVDW